jgi:integrase
VRCMGKVRKERCTPLTKTTVAVLKAWLAEPARRSTEMLFPNASGGRLTGDSVGDLLDKHVAVAGHTCPPRRKKRVTPHALHHYLPFLTMSRPAILASFSPIHARSYPDIVLTPCHPRAGEKGVPP